MVKRACRVLPAEVPCGKQSQKTPPALHRLQIIGKGRETLFDCTFSRRAAWNTRKQAPEIELKSLQNDAETAQSKHGIPGKNLDCQQRRDRASGESTVLLSLQGRLVTQSGSGLSPGTAAGIQADMLPALPKDGAPLHFTISQGTSCSLMIPAARPMLYSAAAPAPSGKWRRHPAQPRICPAGSAPAAHGSQMPSARHSCASGVPQSTQKAQGREHRTSGSSMRSSRDSFCRLTVKRLYYGCGTCPSLCHISRSGISRLLHPAFPAEKRAPMHTRALARMSAERPGSRRIPDGW